MNSIHLIVHKPRHKEDKEISFRKHWSKDEDGKTIFGPLNNVSKFYFRKLKQSKVKTA